MRRLTSIGLALSSALLFSGCGTGVHPSAFLPASAGVTGVPSALTAISSPTVISSIASFPATPATTANSGIVKWGVFSYTNHEWQFVGIDRYSSIVFIIAAKLNTDQSVTVKTSDGTYFNAPSSGSSLIYYQKARTPATWIVQDLANDTGGGLTGGGGGGTGGGGPQPMLAGVPASCVTGVENMGKDTADLLDSVLNPLQWMSFAANLTEWLHNDAETRAACGQNGTYIMPGSSGSTGGAGGTQVLCKIDGADVDCTLMIPYLP